ncbi:MAG: hypothetical protein V3T83_02220 [Acidobacteriota bacterium]
MRRNQLLAFCALFFTTALQAQEVRFFPQIGDGFFEGFPGVPRFRTSFIFVNTGNSPQEFSLEFFTQVGENTVPLELTLENVNTQESVTGTSVTISLGPGESISLQTPGTRDLVVGYARFTVSDDVGGTAVFTGSDLNTGIVLFEAGVPATAARNEFSLFVDSLGNQDTGLAIVGAGATAPAGTMGNSFTLSLFDTAFQQIATTEVPLEPGQHLPKFINEFFQADPEIAEIARELQGSVSVISAGIPMAAVTLRQLQTNLTFPAIVPTLTTFPVIPGAASSMVVTSTQGRFSTVSSGRIRVDADLKEQVESVLLRFYQDGVLVGSALRRPASGQISEYFIVPQGKATDRVTMELRYAGGGVSPELPLEK